MNRPALLRAAVASLLITALGLAAPPAQAAPSAPEGTPVLEAAPAPDDDSNDDSRPVEIRVGRFEPRTLTPGATVTVTGTLANSGSTPIIHLGSITSERSSLYMRSVPMLPGPTMAAVAFLVMSSSSLVS